MKPIRLVAAFLAGALLALWVNLYVTVLPVFRTAEDLKAQNATLNQALATERVERLAERIDLLRILADVQARCDSYFAAAF